MASSAVTQLQIKVNTPGIEKLPKLGNALKRLSTDTLKAGVNTKQLAIQLRNQEKTTVKSINSTRSLAVAWRELAASVKFGSNRFKEATAEARRLDASLAKMQGRRAGRGGRLAGIAKTGGAIAAAGVFGGPEGSIGAAIGGVVGGGPVGAAVGGAIGAQVGMVRQSIGGVASYDAQLELQRRALRLVIGDTKRYQEAQEFLADTSDRLAIPQDVITRQFTQLSASVLGAGGNVKDATEAFEGIASGIRGTGGNLEDMKAAMVATSQVFSKGKVSAEELRQQLGERLPGAFTLFAKSMGKTPAELDKALEGGKVTLKDFMKFTAELTKEYGKNAEELAKGPEAAGQRLITAMSNFKDAIGDILTPIGAAFQSTFAAIVEDITDAIKAFNRFMGIGLDNAIAKTERELGKAREAEERTAGSRGGFRARNRRMQLEAKLTELKGKQTEETKKQNQSLKDQQNIINGTVALYQKIGQAIRSSMVDAIEALITKSKSLGDIFSGLLRQIARMYLTQAIGNLPLPGLSASAKGNVFAQNGIVPFAQGGIVDKPTIFPFANGTGLMGEAGPEAIMPLTRGADGKLGVEAIDRYRPVGSTSSGGEGEVGEGGGGSGGSGGIDVRFNTEIINDVSYVTLSQFQEGVREAAKRGAKEGEAGALNRLRNSPSSRRKVGI